MTIDKLKERYLSATISIIIALINYKLYFSKQIDMESFMDKSIDISSISFGFLLAVLALLLQSDTPAITRIKESGRFGELINFNKKAVIASALLAITGLIYVSLKVATDYSHINLYQTVNLRHLIDCIGLGVFTFQIIEVFLFLDLFYFVIK